MRSLLTVLAIAIILCGISGTAAAGVVVYENDFAGWQAAAAPIGVTSTVDFESVVVPGTIVTIAGNEFPGITLTATVGQLAVAVDSLHNPPNFPAVSGINVFVGHIPGVWLGVTRIVFDMPTRAVGAWFIDVEPSYASTGFDLAGNPAPTYSFSGDQGNRSQVFFGIVSDTEFNFVDLHTPSSGFDAIAIDDLMFVLMLPVPVEKSTWGDIKALYR
jgi:hypothetical protein